MKFYSLKRLLGRPPSQPCVLRQVPAYLLIVVLSHLKEGTCCFCYTARKSILKPYFFTEQDKVIRRRDPVRMSFLRSSYLIVSPYSSWSVTWCDLTKVMVVTKIYTINSIILNIVVAKPQYIPNMAIAYILEISTTHSNRVELSRTWQRLRVALRVQLCSICKPPLKKVYILHPSKRLIHQH